MANLGTQLVTVAWFIYFFDLGITRRAFVTAQVEGAYGWDVPGPWFPGCGRSLT